MVGVDMIVEMALFATTVVLGILSVSPAGSTVVAFQEPSIGDVMLSDTQGIVQIYFTDGIHTPQWGTICGKKSLPNVANVVCRQLGYSGGGKSLTRPPPSQLHVSSGTETLSSNLNTTCSPSRIWLTDVYCGADDTSFSHILQCTYSVIVADNTDNMCQNDDLLSVTCNKALANSPHNGHVRLCHPYGFPNKTQSVSMGLVQIGLYGAWGGINQRNSSHPLGTYTADSICRQLGYTNAVTGNIMTQKSASSLLSNDKSFDWCYHQDANKQAWFNTEQVGCDRSEDCFGCCFSYPTMSNLCSDCNSSNDVVIRCTFDRTVSQDIRQRNCSFAMSESDFKSLRHTTCGKRQEISLRTFEITVGTVGSVAVILFIVLSSTAVGYCSYRLYRRVRRPRAPQGQGQRLLHQQDDAGN